MRLLGAKKFIVFTTHCNRFSQQLQGRSPFHLLTCPLGLSSPVLISLSLDNFFGLCRSLSTFILASLLVMPKTPEKRTTDFRDCAATPKKRRKKRVMVDVDETQTDVDEGIVRYM